MTIEQKMKTLQREIEPVEEDPNEENYDSDYPSKSPSILL